MTKSVNKEKINSLIPAWNSGEQAARNSIIKEIIPWVDGFARLEVERQHEKITTVENLKVNTPVSFWEPEVVRQEVLTLFMERHYKTTLTTAVDLQQLLRLMTHRILLDKIKLIMNKGASRVPISSFGSVDEIIEPMANIDQSVSEMQILLEVLEVLSIKHPEKVMAYVLMHIDGHKTPAISEIMNTDQRTVQRYVKSINLLLKMELKKIQQVAA